MWATENDLSSYNLYGNKKLFLNKVKVVWNLPIGNGIFRTDADIPASSELLFSFRGLCNFNIVSQIPCSVWRMLLVHVVVVSTASFCYALFITSLSCSIVKSRFSVNYYNYYNCYRELSSGTEQIWGITSPAVCFFQKKNWSNTKRYDNYRLTTMKNSSRDFYDVRYVYIMRRWNLEYDIAQYCMHPVLNNKLIVTALRPSISRTARTPTYTVALGVTGRLSPVALVRKLG